MHKRKTQSGFALLELIVALALMAVGIVLLSSISTNSMERDRERLAAQYMRRIMDATQRYVSDNYAALMDSAGTSTAAVLTPSTLRNANYLGTQIGDTNVYGQSTQIRVIEPTSGKLDVLIITNGGQTISEGALRRIARQIGPEGGYVSTSSTTVMTGTYSGWSKTLSTYGASTGGGRVGAGLFFRDSQQVSDYLYRSAVSGRSELNTMNTDLDMGNNSVNNVSSMTATGAVQGATVKATGRTYAGEYIQISGVATVGNSCSTNGMLGREADGRLASCVSGTWRRAGY